MYFFQEQAQSLAFSQDGAVILVGCVNGKWMIFDTQTRELLGESLYAYIVKILKPTFKTFLGHHVDGNEPIQVISFSPDGTMVALGSRDNQIYIYQVSDDGMKYSRVGRCSGHSSYITHVDWAADNQTLRSNSGDYELLFCMLYYQKLISWKFHYTIGCFQGTLAPAGKFPRLV